MDELCSYAVIEESSQGRKYPEKPHPYRSDFERDRDRIIHSSAFRRLEGKTQVFTPGLDDYYRTRLTHSIEVAQIGRTIAKELRINVNLTEAICLAHDLGHPPFGHAGEQVLNDLMSEFGGFEHNHQTLRIVDLLEHPYPDFMGLNLMRETRLALARHTSTYDRPQNGTFPEPNCSLEGQVANIADRIAYNCHDLEDGMRARLITFEQLKNIEIFTEAQNRIDAKSIKDRTISRTRTAKAIINKLVSNCIEETQKILADANIKTPGDVHTRHENLIVLPAKSDAELIELEKFLMQNFYMHKSLIEIMDRVKDWLTRLFEKLCEKPDLMPGYFEHFIPAEGLHRTVTDYIAGMTDRFALKTLKEIQL